MGAFDDIKLIAQQHGVDPDLLSALILQESSGNPRAMSPSGAMGLGQLMPDTAKELGVQDPWDPRQNVTGTAKYLSQLDRMFGGDRAATLAAYHSGPGNVRKAGYGTDENWLQNLGPRGREYPGLVEARIGQPLPDIFGARETGAPNPQFDVAPQTAQAPAAAIPIPPGAAALLAPGLRGASQAEPAQALTRPGDGAFGSGIALGFDPSVEMATPWLQPKPPQAPLPQPDFGRMDESPIRQALQRGSFASGPWLTQPEEYADKSLRGQVGQLPPPDLGDGRVRWPLSDPSRYAERSGAGWMDASGRPPQPANDPVEMPGVRDFDPERIFAETERALRSGELVGMDLNEGMPQQPAHEFMGRSQMPMPQQQPRSSPGLSGLDLSEQDPGRGPRPPIDVGEFERRLGADSRFASKPERDGGWMDATGQPPRPLRGDGFPGAEMGPPMEQIEGGIDRPSLTEDPAAVALKYHLRSSNPEGLFMDDQRQRARAELGRLMDQPAPPTDPNGMDVAMRLARAFAAGGAVTGNKPFIGAEQALAGGEQERLQRSRQPYEQGRERMGDLAKLLGQDQGVRQSNFGMQPPDMVELPDGRMVPATAVDDLLRAETMMDPTSKSVDMDLKRAQAEALRAGIGQADRKLDIAEMRAEAYANFKMLGGKDEVTPNTIRQLAQQLIYFSGPHKREDPKLSLEDAMNMAREQLMLQASFVGAGSGQPAGPRQAQSMDPGGAFKDVTKPTRGPAG